jgi:DNA repair protein RadC
MALDDLPETDRPRERLYFNGPTALADAELLALQLGSGTRGKDAIAVAREMLAAYGSLAGVAGREVDELARRPGVGRAKAARLVAAFELTRRLRARTPGVRTALSTPEDV